MLFTTTLLKYLLNAVLCSADPTIVVGSRLISGQGLGVSGSSEESRRIHRENQEKLQAMCQSEILEEQNKVLSQLGKD